MLLDVAMLIALASFGAYMFMSTPKGHYDPDRSKYPVKGIDISAHNGDIDFGAVISDSIIFAIIKATEGTDFCDARFAINYTKSREAGLKVGAYHFFRFDTPGEVQARHFLSAVNGKQFDMPLIIDVEKWGNTPNYDVSQVCRNLRTMTDAITNAGYKIMLYTNKQGFNTFIKDEFDELPLWICSLSSPPNLEYWSLWQHSHQSRVNGIKEIVDVNTFNGTLSDFEDWTEPYTVYALNTDTAAESPVRQ